MQRGLDGRRIAVAMVSEDPTRAAQAAALRATLERQGASVAALRAGAGSDEDWQGGKYAALVLLGGDGGEADPRLVQLTREVLVSEKPLAVMGGALAVILQAGGAAGRTAAVDQSLISALESAGGKAADQPIHTDGSLVSAKATADVEAFTAQVAREFARSLDDRDVDEMSEQSFPASDPPATTRASLGHSPDDDAGARP